MGQCHFCKIDLMPHEPGCSSRAEADGCPDYKRHCTLSEAARAACVPPRKPTPTFKLANLEEVAKLKSRLDYLDTIRVVLNGRTQAKITVERIDLRPEISAYVVGAIEVAVDNEAAKVRDALADLGVEV